ncbi:MAG: ring-1,2-phenylacetyl-CoA epoxidase subunit PaaE [Bacteroidia bacterium]|jgi:ring-1,2-phenylacetyl-CoA epoxidase subunit PaaE
MSSPTGFYKLKVDKIIRHTPDAVSVRFLVPPGVQDRFKYLAGQYLTFHLELDGEDVRRSYSVCESPYLDAMPSVAIKEVPNGKMSTYFNRTLKEGDLVDSMPPMGKFTVVPDASFERDFVLFAGGSGITPIKSILNTILHQEPKSRITLFYANKNYESIIFKTELDVLAEKHADRFKLVQILDEAPENWNGLSGMLNEMKVQQLMKTFVRAEKPLYFICGPGGLMEVIKTALLQLDVEKERINIEYFTALKKEVDESVSVGAETVTSADIVTQTIRIDVYGDVQDVEVKPDQTILEAAQDAGMDPPFSCTVGVCTTCRAKVNSGTVFMDEREGLSDAEIEEGYVLTCQSHPTSNNVELVYE